MIWVSDCEWREWSLLFLHMRNILGARLLCLDIQYAWHSDLIINKKQGQLWTEDVDRYMEMTEISRDI